MIEADKIHGARKALGEIRCELLSLAEKMLSNGREYSSGEDRTIGLNCLSDQAKMAEAVCCVIQAEGFLDEIGFMSR